MTDQAKLIIEIAASGMSRDALNGWKKFKLPEPDRRIEDLLKSLGEPGRVRKEKISAAGAKSQP